MSYSQQLGRMAATSAIGRIGDAIANASILDKLGIPNPLDPFSLSSTAPQDEAVITPLTQALPNMTAQGQASVVAIAAHSPGGQAFWRKNLAVSVAVGLLAGGAIGYFVGKRR